MAGFALCSYSRQRCPDHVKNWAGRRAAIGWTYWRNAAIPSMRRTELERFHPGFIRPCQAEYAVQRRKGENDNGIIEIVGICKDVICKRTT